MEAQKIRVVVVKPKEYPIVEQVKSISDLCGDSRVRIEAYTKETVILALPQREGMALNRAVYADGGSQIREVVAGDFRVCGLNADGSLRGLTGDEVSLYLERFRQAERFLSAGGILFALPYSKIYG